MEPPYEKHCVKCSNLLSFKTLTGIESGSWGEKMESLTNWEMDSFVMETRTVVNACFTS